MKQHALALVYSVFLHAGLVVLLTVSLARAVPFPEMPLQIAVEATVVDEARIQEEVRKLEKEEQDRIAQRQAEQRRLDKAREERERVEKQLAEVKRKQQVEEEAARQREAKRKRDQAETDARLAAEAKSRQEAERKRLARLERERKQEEERLAEIRRKADAEQTERLEAELREQLEQEERRLTAESAGLLAQYKRDIQQRIERNWIKPPSAGAGLECVVHVTQIPGGEVVDVRVAACNGDMAVVRSIEAAVHKASPLPLPPDRSLFERNLRLIFKPET